MLHRPNLHPFVVVIVVLAGIGLLYQLVIDPLELIKQLFIGAIILGIIILAYRWIMQRRIGTDNFRNNAKYRKAVQQSKKRYFYETSHHLTTKARNSSHSRITNRKKPLHSLQTNKKREHNLKVIDGRKGKKKNRAHF